MSGAGPTSSASLPPSWELRRLRVPAALADGLVAVLWAAGACGFESLPLGGAADGWLHAEESGDPVDEIELRVWTPGPAAKSAEGGEASANDHEIERALADWRALGVEELGREAVAQRDWLAEHRAHSLPIPLGTRLRVDPRDPRDVPEAPSPVRPGEERRIDLLVPAQNAFGTGSHESTRLTVELLERADPAGLDVLDVGVGSGILSLAALALGARSACGFDLDVPSVITARANALRNGESIGRKGRLRLFSGRADALAREDAFDLALVNVLPERVMDDYPRLLGTLRSGGRLISSGNLLDRRDELLERFCAFGLQPIDEQSEGEWVAFAFRLDPTARS